MNENNIKIEELNINLFKGVTEEKYAEERAKFIAEYKVYKESTRRYHSGGLFSMGYWTGEENGYVKDPVQGKAEWNKINPLGYSSWATKQFKLTAHGEQLVINKINEIIKFISEL